MATGKTIFLATPSFRGAHKSWSVDRRDHGYVAALFEQPLEMQSRRSSAKGALASKASRHYKHSLSYRSGRIARIRPNDVPNREPAQDDCGLNTLGHTYWAARFCLVASVKIRRHLFLFMRLPLRGLEELGDARVDLIVSFSVHATALYLTRSRHFPPSTAQSRLLWLRYFFG